MLYDNKTHRNQIKLGEYCRTGAEVELPLSRPENLPVYRRLVFNGVKDTLEQAFPITLEVMPPHQWDEMVSRFFAEHECKAPQLWKIPEEFYSFCETENFSETYNVPFLNDLMLFEWLEIKIHTMPDIQPVPYRETGDVLEDIPVVNPHLIIQNLTFPVHLKSVEDSLKEPGIYSVAIYRHPETDNVHFFNLNPFLEKVILLLAENTFTGREALLSTAKDFNITDFEPVIQHGIAFLNDLLKAHILYGFQSLKP